MFGFYKTLLTGIQFTFEIMRQMVMRSKFKDF
jgi:hypothetical protein